MRKWTLHRIHKWLGLSAALWLAVLGISGFLLDHRDTWRWLWHSGISASRLPDVIVKKAHTGQTRLYQQHPYLSGVQVTGGPLGMWWTQDDGRHWQRTRFQAENGTVTSPMVFTLLFEVAGQDRGPSGTGLWIATDDGVWFSRDNGKTALPMLLQGEWVSALALVQVRGEKSFNITGVVDRSRIFRFSAETKKLQRPELQPVTQNSLPAGIGLSRFVRDLHYGRGVFIVPYSLFWNDVAGIAMLSMPLTGVLFFWLPRRWRRRKQNGESVNLHYKKQFMRWLFRLHAPTLGLIVALPLIYLSLTGVILDHAEGLRGWLKSVEVSRSWQTPVYDLRSWEGEIYGISTARDKQDGFSLATRLGLFTTQDNGQHWQREKFPRDQALFVWSLRQHGDGLLVGGMGGPNLIKSPGKAWQVVKGSGHMPSDISMNLKGDLIWKNRHGLQHGNLKDGFSSLKVSLPVETWIPWFYVIDGLHSGILIHTQWKWINDLIAVIAVLLVITGIVRWWRKKWI